MEAGRLVCLLTFDADLPMWRSGRDASEYMSVAGDSLQGITDPTLSHL